MTTAITSLSIHMRDRRKEHYDYIVVGAGPAGSVAGGIAKASIAIAVPATRRMQQIALADIARFTALVIERRESFLGKRIDIASDELTFATAAAALSEASDGTSSTRRFRSTQYVSGMKISRACTSGSTGWDTTRTSPVFDRSIPRFAGIASGPGLPSRIGQPPASP